MCTFGKLKLTRGWPAVVPPTLKVTSKSLSTFVRPLFGSTRSAKKSAQAPVWPLTPVALSNTR